jgi:hypothetical protein
MTTKISTAIRPLKNQVIEATQPGTLLADFEAFLNFIDSDGIEVSTGNQLLPMNLLREINNQLQNPLHLDLKRPQQKSYPHINALYLLSRVTGLTIVKNVGKKRRLVKNESVQQSWQTLNFTERYFTLLEAWLIYGNTEVIGEYSPFFGLSDFKKIAEKLLAESLHFPEMKSQKSALYGLDTLTIALMELFGWVTIQHSQPEVGQGWRIRKIQLTPLGQAMYLQLFEVNHSNLEKLLERTSGFFLDDTEQIEALPQFGVLQELFKIYFPAWQNTLQLPKPKFQPGQYLFKVFLHKAWRRFNIPGTLTWDNFAQLILEAFEFDDDHLYCFEYRNHFGREIRLNHAYLEEMPFTDETKIGELGLETGDELVFIYDFGDHWEFQILLEEIVPSEHECIQLLEKHGEPPQQYPEYDDGEEEDN